MLLVKALKRDYVSNQGVYTVKPRLVQSNVSWWRHQMETFSALLAHCEGNPPVTGGFPSQRPVKQSFNIFFDLRLNKRLSKQSKRRWFETTSRPLWRHCNVTLICTQCDQMETFSALLALCEGNPPVTSGFPSQRPVTQSFNIFIDLRLKKRPSKKSKRRWFETL